MPKRKRSTFTPGKNRRRGRSLDKIGRHMLARKHYRNSAPGEA